MPNPATDWHARARALTIDGRMVIDGEDFYLDLLFFHRRLRRLVAIELKLGRFKAAHKGQMDLYLKWLDKFERQPGEETPIGLILCAESSREQVELLQMHKDGITVAEYWTELPPKAELEQRLHAALVEARERLARRGVLLGGGEVASPVLLRLREVARRAPG